MHTLLLRTYMSTHTELHFAHAYNPNGYFCAIKFIYLFIYLFDQNDYVPTNNVLNALWFGINFVYMNSIFKINICLSKKKPATFRSGV